MRIRSTKPEFWRSKTIASVSWDARFVLKGLESYVDDNGVGKDDIALIVGDVFPRDMLANPRETVARVTEAVGSLHRAGLIWRYEADGMDLLYVSNWDRLQRVDKPNKGRLPRPDGTMDYKESTIRESVANPRETLAPVTGEQGNRGTGEQGNPVPDVAVTLTSARDEREPDNDPDEENRNPPALVHDDGTPTPAGIVREWERAAGVVQSDSTRAGMRIAVSQCQRAGHDPQTIAQGLADWAGSKMTHPNQIPSFVDRAAVRPRLAPAPAPAKKHNADEWLELGERMAAERGR